MTVHLQQLKGMQSSKQRLWKGGTICQKKVYERSTLNTANGIQKGKGYSLGAEPPRINITPRDLKLKGKLKSE